jgi:hypothetical protein
MSDALFGGRKVAVQFYSGADPSRVLDDTVIVRQLPLRLLPDYLDFQLGNEAALVALLVDKPIEWTDRLTPESAETIMNVGAEVNSGPFERWLRGRTERIARLKPLVSKLAQPNG